MLTAEQYLSERIRRKAFHLLACVILAGLFSGCESEPEMIVSEGQTMGTSYHVSWFKTAQVDIARIDQGIFEVLDSVDSTLSTWQADSELSRINNGGDGWQPVSKLFFDLMAQSQRIGVLTEGAFDPTIGQLVNLWGFGPGRNPGRSFRPPPDHALQEAMEHSGWSRLQLDDEARAVRKPAEMYIDLSGIAKGYGVDAVAAFLEREGITSYLVEVGGEIRLRGPKKDGSKWRVAIEKPADFREIDHVLELQNAAMATSGDYRNWLEYDGQRYSHTISPLSGSPVHHALASVTVIADSAAEADGWATGLLVLGPDKGRQIATQHQIAAYFIMRGENGLENWSSPALSRVTGTGEEGGTRRERVGADPLPASGPPDNADSAANRSGFATEPAGSAAVSAGSASGAEAGGPARRAEASPKANSE